MAIQVGQPVHDFRNIGFLAYDGELHNAMQPQIVQGGSWLTGQGLDVPSRWGNMVITTGQTSYPFVSGEHVVTLIVHVIVGGGLDYNEHINGTVRCTYIAVISTLDDAADISLSTCPAQ